MVLKITPIGRLLEREFGNDNPFLPIAGKDGTRIKQPLATPILNVRS
jgi:hypothetical protein